MWKNKALNKKYNYDNVKVWGEQENRSSNRAKRSKEQEQKFQEIKQYLDRWKAMSGDSGDRVEL